MNHSLERSLLFATLILTFTSSFAMFNIGSKGRVNGPAIHSTYFYTPNNSPFTVSAQAYIGYQTNGNCQYSATYDLGNEVLRTGDVVSIDAFQLKSLVGGGYNCMTILYRYRQTIRDSFSLFFDGINYVTTAPAIDAVTIL